MRTISDKRANEHAEVLSRRINMVIDSGTVLRNGLPAKSLAKDVARGLVMHLNSALEACRTLQALTQPNTPTKR